MYETIEDTLKYIPSLPKGNLAEWGIYSGNTLKRLIVGAEQLNCPFEKVYGFDVFLGGLPKETEGVYINPDWVEGAFDIAADKGLKTVEEAVQFVKDYVQCDYVEYVVGYFADTLTQGMADKIGKETINYAHIDCDIHSSSKLVLDFIFKYRLLCHGGLIRFDDICSTPSNGGQKLALTQCVNKYGFALNQLSSNVFTSL